MPNLAQKLNGPEREKATTQTKLITFSIHDALPMYYTQ